MSGDTLREFLLTFYDMGYISTGEYVFFDLLPFPFPGDYWGNHDWRRGDSRDSDAMKAYEALLRISLFEPISEDWTNFTQLVIKKANETYGFDFRGEKVRKYQIYLFSLLRSLVCVSLLVVSLVFVVFIGCCSSCLFCIRFVMCVVCLVLGRAFVFCVVFVVCLACFVFFSLFFVMFVVCLILGGGFLVFCFVFVLVLFCIVV